MAVNSFLRCNEAGGKYGILRIGTSGALWVDCVEDVAFIAFSSEPYSIQMDVLFAVQSHPERALNSKESSHLQFDHDTRGSNERLLPIVSR